MIKINNSSEVFFTSDTHFSHYNIINYCARPFKDKNDMDEQLINNWNAVVPENGVVFHLGDFKWSGSWNTVLDRLNGKINLILGKSGTGKSILIKKIIYLSNLIMFQIYLKYLHLLYLLILLFLS